MATCIKLSDGNQIPVLGLGTYVRGGSKNKECQLSVEAAISCGYRHIDTATMYKNEEEVGVAIKNKIQDGTVTRNELFIITKLWNDSHAEEQVVPALKDSLSRLGLDYVDHYLVHWPMGFNEDGSFNEIDYLDTWRGMEECKRLGLAKSIGVSNFSIPQLERLLKNCNIKPVINQVEVNINLTQKKLLDFCKKNDIAVIAYSPLAKTSTSSFNDPILKQVAGKYQKTITQVVLRYLLDCGMAAIPKSVTPWRIAQNIDVFDFKLTPEEISRIDELNQDRRVVPVMLWKDHKYYPFK